jgi:hypothetical protein
MPKDPPPKPPLGFKYRSLFNNEVIVTTEDPHKSGPKAKKAQQAVADSNTIVLEDDAEAVITQPVDQPEAKEPVVAPPTKWKSSYDDNRKVQEDWQRDPRLTCFKPIESMLTNGDGKRECVVRQECITCTTVTGHSVTVKNKVHNMLKHLGVTTGPPTLQGVYFFDALNYNVEASPVKKSIAGPRALAKVLAEPTDLSTALWAGYTFLLHGADPFACEL